jgi:hypothetical protein
MYGNVFYCYSTGGRKAREQNIVNVTTTLIRYYVRPFTFISGTTDPEYVYTPHGRFIQKDGIWRHETHLRNHLGNTRLAYIHDGTTINKSQETHYYPFGMRISPSPTNP